jgi:hypothetical protein
MSSEKIAKEKKKVVTQESNNTKNDEKRRHPDLKEVTVGDSILLLTTSCPSVLTPPDKKTHKAWSKVISKTIVTNKNSKENWEI